MNIRFVGGLLSAYALTKDEVILLFLWGKFNRDSTFSSVQSIFFSKKLLVIVVVPFLVSISIMLSFETPVFLIMVLGKLAILFVNYPDKNLLNKRSEIMAKCRHRRKFDLELFDGKIDVT